MNKKMRNISRRMSAMFIAAVMLVGMLSFGGIVSAQIEPPRYVYLAMGQSNMYYRGELGDTATDDTPENVFFLSNDTDPAQWHWQYPVNVEEGKWSVAKGGIGPLYSFAVDIQQYHSEPVGIVDCAKSGQDVAYFKKGAEGYTRALARAQRAVADGAQIMGLIWHQGENDITNNTADLPVYANVVKQIVADLKADLELDTLPFVAGEVGQWLAGSTRREELIRQVHLLPALMPYTAIVMTEGLASRGDNVHFGYADYLALGSRYATAMERAVKNKNLTEKDRMLAVRDVKYKKLADNVETEVGEPESGYIITEAQVKNWGTSAKSVALFTAVYDGANQLKAVGMDKKAVGIGGVQTLKTGAQVAHPAEQYRYFLWDVTDGAISPVGRETITTLFAETFDSYEENAAPPFAIGLARWQKAGSATVKIANVPSAADKSINVAGDGARFFRDTALSGKTVIAVDVMRLQAVKSEAILELRTMSSDKPIMLLYNQSGGFRLQYGNADGQNTYTPEGEYPAFVVNTWYTVRVEVNVPLQTFSVFIGPKGGEISQQWSQHMPFYYRDRAAGNINRLHARAASGLSFYLNNYVIQTVETE